MRFGARSSAKSRAAADGCNDKEPPQVSGYLPAWSAVRKHQPAPSPVGSWSCRLGGRSRRRWIRRPWWAFCGDMLHCGETRLALPEVRRGARRNCATAKDLAPKPNWNAASVNRDRPAPKIGNSPLQTKRSIKVSPSPVTASRTLRGTCVSGGADLKSAKRNQPGTRSCQDGDFKRRRKGALHDHCQCGFRSELRRHNLDRCRYL